MKTLFSLFLFLSFFFLANAIFAQKFQEAKAIPKGKGVVYIYRPWNAAGALTYYQVKVNKENVSNGHHLRNGKYLVHMAEPGMNTFWAYDGSKMRVEIEVEADKTYYIKGTCCKLEVASEGEAKKKINKCKLSVW